MERNRIEVNGKTIILYGLVPVRIARAKVKILGHGGKSLQATRRRRAEWP